MLIFLKQTKGSHKTNKHFKGNEMDKEHEQAIQFMKQYNWPINMWSKDQSHQPLNTNLFLYIILSKIKNL